MTAEFPASAFERATALAAGSAEAERQPVFILGMPRSGTTLVEQILSSHPHVAAGGELPFWSKVSRSRGSSANELSDALGLAKSAEDYRVLLAELGPGARRVTDKWPLNFEQIGLILTGLPDARIIHCRRHPVDTCLSMFFQNFWEGNEFAWDRGDLVFFYRQYERLMAHWRRVLPPDQLLELDYEKLIANREAETRRVLAFVGLDRDDACLAHERNTRVVKTASVWQARQPIYTTSVERWRRYEPWLGELRALLPPAEAPA